MASKTVSKPEKTTANIDSTPVYIWFINSFVFSAFVVFILYDTVTSIHTLKQNTNSLPIESVPISKTAYYIPNSPEQLHKYLSVAMSLELSTLPLYLTAYLSFKDDNILSNTAKDAKSLIYDVMSDEMLHMALLSNIISSIYGIDKIEACYNINYTINAKLPANIRLDIDNLSLRPFSKNLLYTLIQIEAPASLIQEHKPIITNYNEIYPFQPSNGTNNITLTFYKKDDLNQISEFYDAIKLGLKYLTNTKQITFSSDNKQHKQRQCQINNINNVNDAINAIDLICSQGEGYELKEGVFSAMVDQNTVSEKTHFIKYIELLAGRKLLSLYLMEDTNEYVTYQFSFEDEIKKSYYVNYDKEIYSIENFKNIAPHNMFNYYWKDLLIKLTHGLKIGNLHESGSIQAMYTLIWKFKECMENGVYPNFNIDCPMPPDII